MLPSQTQDPPPAQVASATPVQAAAPAAAQAQVPVDAAPSGGSAGTTDGMQVDQDAQDEKPARQEASTEEMAQAKPCGVDQLTDSERVRALRAALRANLEMGCSSIELQTSVDSINRALGHDEGLLDAGPKTKHQRETDDAASLEVDAKQQSAAAHVSTTEQTTADDNADTEDPPRGNHTRDSRSRSAERRRAKSSPSLHR